MNIAICEDEYLFSSLLKDKIDDFFNKKNLLINVDIYDNGTELLDKCVHSCNYNVIFMDIGLGNNDGMDIAAKIRKLDMKAILIFVTSFDNRAIEGYDINAFGYVVKQTLNERLPELLERLWSELTKNQGIIINDDGVINLLFTEDMIAVESLGRKTLVHMIHGDITVNKGINKFSEQLSTDSFVECHKSVYINISKIKRIDAHIITLENEKTFPVSRRNRKEVMLAVMKRVGV